MPETKVVPKGKDKFNVLRCMNSNTWAKYIKITAGNPNKSREWVFVLIEVKVFGTTEEFAVDDVLEELLNDIF